MDPLETLRRLRDAINRRNWVEAVGALAQDETVCS